MKSLSIILGPLLSLVTGLVPLGLEPEAQTVSALLVWIVVWWVTEAVPIPVTALFVPVLGIFFQVIEPKAAFSSFGHPLVFLFMGGFFLARAVTDHQLDRRISLTVLLSPGVKGNPGRSLVAIILLSASLSMLISNTATTAMLLPIALAVATAIFPKDRYSQGLFLLPVAYASSIGGITTPIGSTPNLIAMGLFEEKLGLRITFFEWMYHAAPISMLLLIILIIVTRYRLKELPDVMNISSLQSEFLKLGKVRASELRTLFCVGLAAFLWILPSLVGIFLGKKHPAAQWLFEHFPESMVAILVSVLLFIIRDEKSEPLLKWSSAKQIDWGTLILFGGGICLGKMVFQSGLAEVLASNLLSLAGGSAIILIALAVVFSIFFTEICSNTATANMLLPITLGVAVQAGSAEFSSVFAVAVACSLAFMMPISTPPNAIAYGSGLISMQTMLRQGFVLNLLSIAVILTFVFLLTSMFA